MLYVWYGILAVVTTIFGIQFLCNRNLSLRLAANPNVSDFRTADGVAILMMWPDVQHSDSREFGLCENGSDIFDTALLSAGID